MSIVERIKELCHKTWRWSVQQEGTDHFPALPFTGKVLSLSKLQFYYLQNGQKIPAFQDFCYKLEIIQGLVLNVWTLFLTDQVWDSEVVPGTTEEQRIASGRQRNVEQRGNWCLQVSRSIWAQEESRWHETQNDRADRQWLSRKLAVWPGGIEGMCSGMEMLEWVPGARMEAGPNNCEGAL